MLIIHKNTEAPTFLSKESFNSIEGWCSFEKAKRLYELVQQTCTEFENPVSVEAGVFGGKSILPIAISHKDAKKGYVFGVDTWDNETPCEGTNSQLNNKWWKELNMDHVYASFLLLVSHFKLRGYCRFTQARTDFAARLFDNNTITLFHQDSNHNTETIIKELDLWIPKLKKGAYWIADDTDWVEARDGYSKLPNYGLELIENNDTWQVWKKK